MTTLVPFEGLHNVRDLGGVVAADGATIRPGMLYRSDQLYFATARDLEALASMNLGAVFDFRSHPEHVEKPDPAIPGARNLHLPVFEDLHVGVTRSEQDNARMIELVTSGRATEEIVDAHMRKLYTEFMSNPHATEQYACFIDETIAEAREGRAVLWHCTAGKDRAGFATVIMLEALGVPRDVIAADYLRTNDILASTVEALVAQFAEKLPSAAAGGALKRFFMADETYLQTAYETAAAQYGGFDGYLEQALGIDSAKRDVMRELFLRREG